MTMVHPDQNFGNIFYSQNGEDLLIVNLFSLMDINKPSFLDIGAHSPSIISNTKLLYDGGSRGINVEANPHLMVDFYRERPEDKNLSLAVDLMQGSCLFYMYDQSSGRNTTSYAETQAYGYKINEIIEVPSMTLNQVVDIYAGGKFPDFLNCDVEGKDLMIMETTNFVNSKPKVICVEVRKEFSKTMVNILNKKGFAVLCRMGENLIFVDNMHYLDLF